MTSKGFILETERQYLRELMLDDALWLLDMLNQPSFIRNIGDRGVRTQADAENYLRTALLDHYAAHGFGMWLAMAKLPLRPDEAKPDTALGLCGLVKREQLEYPDVGFAYLPEFWGLGLATEAAEAVVAYARQRQLSPKLLGITSLDNSGSIHVLEKIGMRFQNLIGFDGEDEDTRLYSLHLD